MSKKKTTKTKVEEDVTPGWKIKFPEKLSKTAQAMLKYSTNSQNFDMRAIMK